MLPPCLGLKCVGLVIVSVVEEVMRTVVMRKGQALKAISKVFSVTGCGGL
jgi:hypothetical protein